ALSTRWNHIWKHVPGLNLEYDDFSEHDSFVSFVDSFLSFNRDTCLHKFKVTYDYSEADEPETGLVRRWLDTVSRMKVKTLDVTDDSAESWELEMTPALYTCGSLVSLKLVGLTLPSPDLVSLPSLKDINLILVEFTDEWALEKFISQCPSLKNLCIERSFGDDIPMLRVRSQSLLTFIHIVDSDESFDDERILEIDAPMLEYLKLSDGRTASFKLENTASLVGVHINTAFNLTSTRRFCPNDAQKRNMIQNFLLMISRVDNMVIASCTLEVIYEYSRYEQLPVFRNLSSLRVNLDGYVWEMLPVFLESCPNLTTLVLGSIQNHVKVGITVSPRRPRVLPSLRYVEIERPFKGDALEMQLVGYLLVNSQSLKKLTLRLDDSLKKERSLSCSLMIHHIINESAYKFVL
ncbi:BnaAnng39580D, partial [Brassica napus]